MKKTKGKSMPRKIFNFVWQQLKFQKKRLGMLLVTISISVMMVDIMVPYVFGGIIDKIQSNVPGMNFDAFNNIFGVLILLFIFGRLFSRLSWMRMKYDHIRLSAATLRDLENAVRVDMMRHPLSLYNSTFAGSLVSKDNKFISAIDVLIDQIIINLWPAFLRFTGMVLAMYTISFEIATVMLAYGFIYQTVLYVISKYKLQFDIVSSRMNSKLTGFMADIYSNMMTIQLFAREDYEIERYKKENQKRFEARLKSWRWTNIRDNTISTMNDLMVVGIVLFALYKWNLGIITTGSIVIIFTYSNQLRVFLNSLGQVIKNVMRSYSDMVEMMEYIDQETLIKDPENPEPVRMNKGAIEFRDVSFGYPEKDELLFENFNLEIPAGQKVAFVGPSGSGKTTVTQFLPRMMDVKSGHICIDDQGIDSILKSELRRKLSIIPQEPLLQHRRIRDIVAYGKPNATDDEIIIALKRAQAYEFVMANPEGLDLIVGERGVKLSGGQKQRIAIARALLESTPVLILDEATSALDAKAEKQVSLALESLFEDKRTMIVVAHRLSTVMPLDRVIVLSEGRIIEDGAPHELLQRKGHFYDLWKEQLDEKSFKFQFDLLSENEKRELFEEYLSTQALSV